MGIPVGRPAPDPVNARSRRALPYTLASVVAACIAAVLVPAFVAAKKPPRLPDLVVVGISKPPSSLTIGRSFALSARVANLGVRSTPVTRTGFFLSLDRKLNRGDRRLRGAMKVGRLRPRLRTMTRTTVRVQTGSRPGRYFLLACADATRRVKERNERNNCRASRSRVVVRGAPVTPQPTTPPADNPPPGAPPPGDRPPSDLDGDGFAAPADCNDADATIHPGAADPPEMAFVDSNCDGIDGDVERALFVSPLGDDANLGTMTAPKRTFGNAIPAAKNAGKDVYASRGIYPEPLFMTDRVSVYGGYSPDWSRSLANETRLTDAPTGGAAGAATLVVTPTTMQHLTLVAPNASGIDPDVTHLGAGNTSYGLLVRSSPALVVDRIVVRAGAGAPGAQGAAGAKGADGKNGAPGGAGRCAGDVSGGGGGVTGPRTGRQGGEGGAGGTDSSGGKDGQDGAGVDAGPGGPGGAASAGNGGPGNNGGAGLFKGDGAGGDGGGPTNDANRTWLSRAGQPGQKGGDGSGGGGGGGSGGGNGGGEGGDGGEGGTGGRGGGGGGGSFGIFLADSSGVLIKNSTIVAADGGNGGLGGAGGDASAGGQRGAGNATCLSGIGKGGDGGLGGGGARGGGGGGGAGGPSVAIFTADSIITTQGNTLSHGSGGAGGSGSGGVGGAGLAADTN